MSDEAAGCLCMDLSLPLLRFRTSLLQTSVLAFYSDSLLLTQTCVLEGDYFLEDIPTYSWLHVSQ